VTAPAGSRTISGAETVASAVTALFVPGDRPERFAKAAAAGAGVVIIDLEDAVAPEAKSAALTAAVEAVAPSDGGAGVRALVRVNPQGSGHYDADITLLLSAARTPGSGLLGIVVPKAEDPAALRQLRSDMPNHLALVPLVESALGVVNAVELARVPGVTRLAFGAIDFALDIDADGGTAFLTMPAPSWSSPRGLPASRRRWIHLPQTSRTPSVWRRQPGWPGTSVSAASSASTQPSWLPFMGHSHPRQQTWSGHCP
jgi:citrate lyase subunit beta/citryl-CoA lyase